VRQERLCPYFAGQGFLRDEELYGKVVGGDGVWNTSNVLNDYSWLMKSWLTYRFTLQQSADDLHYIHHIGKRPQQEQ